MHIGKSVQESLDGAFVQCFRTLIYLEDFLVALHIVTADGERNHELDAIGLAEAGKRSHLLGIKRTEDDITCIGSLLQQGGADISVYRHVPCMHIGRDTLLFQIIASHQESTIILHHTLAITIHIMQRQHHANLHRITSRNLLLSGSGSSYSRFAGSNSILILLLCLFRRIRILLVAGKRNKEGSSLLEHVTFLLHLRVCLHQFRQTQSILIGNTKNSILFLHCVDVTPFRCLSKDTNTEHEPHNHQEISYVSFHIFLFLMFI